MTHCMIHIQITHYLNCSSLAKYFTVLKILLPQTIRNTSLICIFFFYTLNRKYDESILAPKIAAGAAKMSNRKILIEHSFYSSLMS